MVHQESDGKDLPWVAAKFPKGGSPSVAAASDPRRVDLQASEMGNGAGRGDSESGHDGGQEPTECAVGSEVGEGGSLGRPGEVKEFPPAPRDLEMKDFADSIYQFAAQVAGMLSGEALGKGYSSDGSGRWLIDAVAKITGDSDAHPAGEIIYKVRRWESKRDPKDLVKIAAWAFLMWDRVQRDGSLKKKS